MKTENWKLKKLQKAGGLLASMALALSVFSFAQLTVLELPKASATPDAVNITTLISGGVDSVDSSNECSSSGQTSNSADVPCWKWVASSKTLWLMDQSYATVTISGEITDDVTLAFYDETGTAALNAPPTNGPTLTAASGLTVKAGKTLTIADYANLTNNDTITVEKGATLAGSATAKVTGGTIKNYGTVAATLQTTATFIQMTNEKAGVCDAPQAADMTGTPNPADQSVSTGWPADNVWCDVTVKMIIPETISLKVNTKEVTIPSPTPGVNNGFQESAIDGLEAVVNTNSSDGYTVLLSGVSKSSSAWGSSAACAAETDMCSVNTAGNAVLNKILGNGFTVPSTAAASAPPTAAAWGVRFGQGPIIDDELDGSCSGRMAKGQVSPTDASTDVSDSALNKTDCEDTNPTSADLEALVAINPSENASSATLDSQGVWTPNAGDGTAATTANVSRIANVDQTPSNPTDEYLAIPATDTALTNAFPGSGFCDPSAVSGAANACPGATSLAGGTPDPQRGTYSHPVTNAKIWFRFGAVVKASTASGEYKGRVRITATPIP